MELKVGRKAKAYLFQIFCKAKDRTQRVNKSCNPKVAHAFIGENFERDFMEYGIWDMNEWMVWKCYSSGVEVFACGGGVYVILDHESMKNNSQRSQHLTKLKVIQVACNKVVSL